MQGPHSRSNYLDSELRLIMGAEPRQEDIQSILNSGVTVFINLKEELNYELPDYIEYHHFPIKSGKAPTIKMMNEILSVFNTNKRIYFHCTGGHGRAGLVACIVIGKMYNFDTVEAIEYVKRCRNDRSDSSRNFIPIPEMQVQVNLIVKFLGLKPENTKPDRSNRDWLRQVIKHRNS
jgi:hypothetical protein